MVEPHLIQEQTALGRNPWPKGRSPLRFTFTLRSLLAVITLAAVASCAVFSQHLDWDESLFVLCFPVGLLAGIRVGRWRGRSGILEAALGGSLSCLAASFLANDFFRLRYLRLGLPEYLALSIPAGLVAGGAIGACLWFLLDAPPLTHRRRWWLLGGGGVGLLLGIGGLIAWGYVQAARWSPRIELPNPRIREPNADTRVIRAFSPQGNFLIVQWEDYHQGQHEFELFQVERRRLQPLPHSWLPADAMSIEFSPDEGWAAFLAERPQKLKIEKLHEEQSQSLTVRYLDYSNSGEELLISRDGQQIFACWDSLQVQRWEAFASDDLHELSNQKFDFAGRLFVSPSGTWLVKMHHPRSASGWEDWNVPVRAEIVRTADRRVVREQVIQATLTVPDNSPADVDYLLLQNIINEMFPDSKVRLSLEGRQLTIRGYAQDAEESAQLVALVRSQINPPRKPAPAAAPGAPSRQPPLPVINLLSDLSRADRPLFDPDETWVAFGHRVFSLVSSPGTDSVRELPGKIVGLLPKGRALVVIDSEPAIETRIPFLRHWFPAGRISQLCLMNIATGKTLRRSRTYRFGFRQLRLARDCRTAVALDGHNTLQIWDIPQAE